MSIARLALAATALMALGVPALPDWPQLRHRNPQRQQELGEKLSSIRLERPRMFVGAEDFDRVRRRIADIPPVGECYGRLSQWAHSDHFYRNLWVTPKQLQAACFCYRVENTAPELLQHCLAIMDYLCEAKPDSWTYPRVVRGLSMAYDWLHEDLTEQQRTKYAARIVECAKACYSTWRHSEINNHLYLEYGPVLYAGIALYQDGFEEQTVEQLLLDGIELLLDNFVPAHELISGEDGGWYESMSYHAFFTPEYAHLLELWRSATGENLWSGPGSLTGDALWLVYNHRPWDYSRIGIADIGGRDSFDTGIAWYLPLLVAHHRDGVAKWWLDELKQEALKRHEAGSNYALAPHMWWPYVLWYDAAVPTADLSALPLARLFRGLGWVSMRSSWERDANFAVFICGDWLGGHQHCDNNSFVIHRRAPLAIDSGVYDAGPHRANYSARSIAHNTVLVHDPEETFAGGVWGQQTGANYRTENDGGQLYTPSPGRTRDLAVGSEYDRGDIIAYEAGTGYTYVVGDATRSYSNSKLREFTRAFVHLQPDVFVVFDRVEATGDDLRKTWLLHSVNEPTLADDVIEIQNGEGRLWCKRLWPSAAQVHKVGGPGHEFEVNGRNFPSSKANAESGSWRVEVSPAERAARSYFLHVISTQESPKATCTRADGAIVVHIKTGQAVYELSFRTEGRVGGRLIIESGGERVEHELPDKVVVKR